MGASSSQLRDSSREKDQIIMKLKQENTNLSNKIDKLEKTFNDLANRLEASYEKYALDKSVIEINNKTYKMIEKVGEGGFGVVYKARREGKEYAIKKISDQDSIKKEIKFLIQVNNMNLNLIQSN
jgi:hypothetical protein